MTMELDAIQRGSAGQPASGASNAIDPLLREGAVRAATGLGTSARYALMAKGEFPRPVLIGTRHVAWKASEVQAWIDARPRSTGGSSPLRAHAS